MVDVTENSIKINLKKTIDDSYDIIIGVDLFPQIAKELKEKPLGNRYLIITDSNVRDIYNEGLLTCLKNEKIDAEHVYIKAGERSKTLDSCVGIIEYMSSSKFGRDSAIIALGGGVVGDLGGFVAAIFNRGIPYIQIPTTLVAQADSSIGGKTAVDTLHGKNLIGAFKQPKKVYIDVTTLKTLDDEEFRNGLAETIKHGMIEDREFFSYLQQNLDKILCRHDECLLHIAEKNCIIKGNVVEKDPNEKGMRRILNYGHTAGHAIEKLSKYTISHGEAVAIGMMVAGRISNKLGHLLKEDLQEQKELLIRAKLPVKIPRKISSEDIINVTTVDKKAKAGQARYVLPILIGQMHEFNGEYATYVDSDIVKEAIESTR